MNITVAMLIYKSPAYLDFVVNSLIEHPSKDHNVNYLIVCNDATVDVILQAEKWSRHPGVRHVVHENENPEDWWIQNVYNAWNRCLAETKTEAICFVNSDMAFTDEWLDALAFYDLDKFIPTSKLVESGRMPSLPGLISKNFGQTLDDFNRKEFESFARGISRPAVQFSCGAYMPSLFKTSTLKNIGGWRKNTGAPGGGIITPGDRITFGLLKDQGL
ncbi:glycosyltransferase family 2 protein, partial [Candidatus Bathyarchaeota archaeon]